MTWFRSGLALVLAMLACPFAAADYPIKIRDVRVGLPAGLYVEDDSGRGAYVVKNNTWAPVYVWFELLEELRSEAAIVVETTDSDDLSNRTAVVLQNLTAEQPGTRFQPAELRYTPYVRPSGHGDITVTIRIPRAGTSPDLWRPLSDPFRLRYTHTRDVSKYVVLSLGSTLPGFTLPREAEVEEPAEGMNESKRRPLRGGRIEMAAILNVAEMPDQWFGYESADIVILSTGTSDKFLDALFADANKPRLDALLEWVRRGGRLVVSAGRNASLAAQYPKLQEILPATIKPDTAQIAKLPIQWGLLRGNSPYITTQIPLAGLNAAPFAVANLAAKADRGVHTLVPPQDRLGDGNRPVVLQSAFGLGRVTLVAFDLDNSPFRDWNVTYRGEFWDTLLREAGAAKASTGAIGVAASSSRNSYGSLGDSEDELTTGLRGYVDHFEGVAVISFGWVAVFILLYTLLIGPVEYFFLKKVLKRLELTWITFPIIVLSVSAIAYFTAYAIKGKDMKMNKVDLIDIDPASGRIYGRFWLTVFSPRVETFRIGMAPNPGWADGPNESPTTGSFVNWFGGTQSGRESLFRRSYYYRMDPPGGASRQPFDEGLVDVPIRVWSTKAFSAEWSASLDKAAPLVVSNLSHPPADPSKVGGKFTLNLPLAELKDVYIIYAGKAYKWPNPIRCGEEENLFLDEKNLDSAWLANFGALEAASVTANPVRTRSNSNSYNQEQSARVNLADLLFHERSLEGNDSTAPKNGSLRRLDQSWRVSPQNRDEIIVLARLATQAGPAEEILTAKDSLSPSRLWLKELPGEGQRTPIPGTLRQDTYLRIYVPIKR